MLIHVGVLKSKGGITVHGRREEVSHLLPLNKCPDPMFQDQGSSEQPALRLTLIQGGIVGYNSS